MALRGVVLSRYFILRGKNEKIRNGYFFEQRGKLFQYFNPNLEFIRRNQEILSKQDAKTEQNNNLPKVRDFSKLEVRKLLKRELLAKQGKKNDKVATKNKHSRLRRGKKIKHPQQQAKRRKKNSTTNQGFFLYLYPN